MVIRYAFAVTALIAGAALIAPAWYGPFVFGVSARSPMNAASIFAAAVVLLLSWRRQTERSVVNAAPLGPQLRAC